MFVPTNMGPYSRCACHLTNRCSGHLTRPPFLLPQKQASPQMPLNSQAVMGSGLALTYFLRHVFGMVRPLRLELSGGLYHVTARGDGREDIYLGDAVELTDATPIGGLP